jgi:hypothetical protein
MPTKINSINLFKLVACAVLALAAVARAEDKKADPTGTWTWSVPARNGGPDRTNTLALKVEGDKLTGALSSPRRGGEIAETPIKDGTVKGEDISFTVTREFNGNTMTSKYSGKVSGDTIKGKNEFQRDGESQSRDWSASRQASQPDKTDKPDKK